MNKILAGIILILLMPGKNTWGQNLVPNPGFEDTVYCPNATNQMDRCAEWSSAGMPFISTPDYFNTCSSNQYISPPLVSWGDQVPKSGNAFCFIITYVSFETDGREYIMCNLNNALIIGQTYYVSFFINLGGQNGVAISSNKIGALFTTSAFTPTNFSQPLNFSTVFTDSLISDTTNWYHFKQSFVADSNYQFMTIGNFFNDINTDIIILDTSANVSGYFIDEVCVSADSNTCYIQTSISELFLEDIFIYPNPANNVVNIPDKIVFYKIYNSLGRLILSNMANNNYSHKINCALWPNGIYFLRTDSEYYLKFIIHH